MRIFLEYAQGQDRIARARLTYAFRVFCAVHGHTPVCGPEPDSADACISYRIGNRARTVYLQSAPVSRSPQWPAPRPSPYRNRTIDTVLFWPKSDGREPDWLAEMFEWISCADEYSCRTFDRIGRVPFTASYIGRYGLDQHRPYAALAMSALQSQLRAFARADEPSAESCCHFVVNCHDVDFLPLTHLSSLQRLTKNALLSLLVLGDAALATQQLGNAIRMIANGPDPLDQLLRLAEEEKKRGVSSVFHFVANRTHRRDPNYDICDSRLFALMQRLVSMGMDVGLHASYCCSDSKQRLASEYGYLRAAGFDAYGSTYHWLRFTLDHLIPAVEGAGGMYDASLGWSDTMGYRAGACFAFPPYNFAEERPARFLEIPLIIMDQNVPCSGGKVDATAVHEVLSWSRRLGQGGVALSWHPTAFGGGQFRCGVGDLFWNLIDRREEFGDRWVTPLRFMEAARNRYVQVGLLDPVTRHDPLTCSAPGQHTILAEGRRAASRYRDLARRSADQE